MKIEQIKIFGPAYDFSPKLSAIIEINKVASKEESVDISKIVEKSISKSSLVAIRVVSGSISVIISEKNEYTASQGSLVFFTLKDLEKAEATEGFIGTFYIFSGADKLLPPLKIKTIYNFPYDESEKEIISHIMQCKNDWDIISNSQINSLFEMQFYNWVELYNNKKKIVGIYSNEIKEAIGFIDKNLFNKISFSELAAKINFSERNFRKVFTDYVGISPKAYMQEQRLKSAATELKNGTYNISEISENLGYYSQFQFSRDFKKYFGISPSEYKKNIISQEKQI